MTLSGEGIEVNSIGIDTTNNAVIVGLKVATEEDEARLTSEFGQSLTFRQQNPAADDTCTSVAACWPPKGGFEITASQSLGTHCTSGWIVKRTDQSATRQILTAGHCIFAGGGGGAPWFHGASSGTSIGDGQSNTWVGSGSHDADVGLVGIVTTKVPPIRNQFIWGLSGGPLVSSVTQQFTHDLQWVGDGVCRFGITSFRDCRLITMEDVARRSCYLGTCKWIDRTWEVSIDAQGGDSGGPVYFNYGAAPYIANGTHVHSDDGPYDPGPNGRGWYTPVDLGRANYLAVSGITYNICLTSAC